MAKFRFMELFVVVHGQTLFLYAPCCACRSSAPLRGALLSCVDKKVTKEATRGGTEVDPIENLWFRSPSPRIKTVLPGAPPDKNSSQLWFLSSNIRSNSDLSACLKFAKASCLSLWERCLEEAERVNTPSIYQADRRHGRDQGFSLRRSCRAERD